MTTTIQRPVTAPYSSDVHQAAWEAWDEQVEKFIQERNIPRNHVDTTMNRYMFMDGFIKGLQS